MSIKSKLCIREAGGVTTKVLKVEKQKFRLEQHRTSDGPNHIKLKLDPIALRKAKIVYNFGLSECNRVKGPTDTINCLAVKRLFSSSF